MEDYREQWREVMNELKDCVQVWSDKLLVFGYPGLRLIRNHIYRDGCWIWINGRQTIQQYVEWQNWLRNLKAVQQYAEQLNWFRLLKEELE